MSHASRPSLLSLGRIHVLALVIGGLLLAPSVEAQPRPVIQINTSTGLSELEPAIAVQSTGEMFFAWAPGARRYEANGTPRDAEDFDPGVGLQVDVAMNDQGDAVVVGSLSSEIQARLYAFDDSVPPSDLIAVNPTDPTATFEIQSHPSVAIDATGSFVVAYTARFPEVPEAIIFLRRFGPDGFPLDEAQRVNGPDQIDVKVPQVAIGPDGTIAVVWQNGTNFSTGDDRVAMLRYYESDGTPMTDPILLSPQPAARPSLAFTSTGSLLVAYQGAAGAWGSLFDPSGQLTAGPTQYFDSPPGDEPSGVQAAALDSGEFQLAWWTFNNNGGDVYSLQIAADGITPQGPRQLVHTNTAGVQRWPDIAAVGNETIITFENPDTSISGIGAACFLSDGCVDVFLDGFESGNTSAWSASLP